MSKLQSKMNHKWRKRQKNYTKSKFLTCFHFVDEGKTDKLYNLLYDMPQISKKVDCSSGQFKSQIEGQRIHYN